MPSLRIALRYLFAPKSHAAVNVITMISMAGIAVAAMAMVCVLSVFNGFRDLAGSRLSAIDPDIKVTLASGGMIADGDSVAAFIQSIEGVAAVRPTIEQRALASGSGQTQVPVKVRGIADDYSAVSAISSTVIDGEMVDHSTPLPCALLSVGTALSTGERPSYDQRFFLTVPRRLGRINPAFPMAAFLTDTLMVSGVYRTEQAEYDDGLVYIPIDVARRLFDYPTEASTLDIAVTPGWDPSDVARRIGQSLGPSYIAADRLRQQAHSFRMIRIEKWITFLMLLFVLIMASFNILSTMSMLIIEKEESVSTLRALGAPPSMLRAIFRKEGMLIALLGGSLGLILGAILALLQQHYGLIALSGDPAHLSITYYPCRLDPADLLITAAAVIAIGFTAGLVASRSVKVAS